MKNELTKFSIYVERERERERERILLSNERGKLLFNFPNRKRGGRYLISDTSFEVLDYE